MDERGWCRPREGRVIAARVPMALTLVLHVQAVTVQSCSRLFSSQLPCQGGLAPTSFYKYRPWRHREVRSLPRSRSW